MKRIAIIGDHPLQLLAALNEQGIEVVVGAEPVCVRVIDYNVGYTEPHIFRRDPEPWQRKHKRYKSWT